MAKASVTVICKTCGKEFTHTKVCFNRRDADRYEEWAKDNIDECSECYSARMRKAREEAQEKAIKEHEELGLPAVFGSSRDLVARACTARVKIWKEIGREEKHLRELVAAGKGDLVKDGAREILEAAKTMVMTDTNASTWTLFDGDLGMRAFRDTIKKRIASNKVKPAQTEAPAVKQRTVTEPEERRHDSEVEIEIVSGGTVTMRTAKDETFIATAKEMGFRWDPANKAWYIRQSEKNGTAQDRAAEAGNVLLRKGFAIVANEEIARKAVDADFEPLCRRWIEAYSGSLLITWDGKDDRLYGAARKISGSKWTGIGVSVPATRYRELEDLANAFGMKFTEGAGRIIEAQRSATTVKKAEAKQPKEIEEHPVAEILNSSRDVIEDLKDED